MAPPRTPKGRSATPKPTACIAADCGKPLFGGPPFCAYCGAPQAAPEPIASPPPPAAPPTAAPPPAPKGPWSVTAAAPPPAATTGVPETPDVKPVKAGARPAPKPAPAKPPPTPPTPPPVSPKPIGPQPIAGLPREDKKKKKKGCGCLLIGLGVMFLISMILAAIGGEGESSGMQTLYVNRGVSVRTQADAQGNTPVDAMVRGAEVKGEWVTETGGTERWLKLSEGPYAGRYLWGRNLSSKPRPVLTTKLDERRRVARLAPLYEEPGRGSKRLETLPAKTRVALVGQTETGWWEVIRSEGGVGYLEPEAFSQGEPEPLAAPVAEAPAGGSPSFDCKAVRNLVKKAICADPRLGQADRELADLYEDALVRGPDPAAVRTEQRAWIRRRDAGSAEVSHLLGLYEQRAAELRRARPAAPSRPTVTRQTTTTTVTVTNRDWVRRPSEEDFARHYPERAARAGVEGRAVLTCTVTELGVLRDCRVLEESPSGYEFGRAALRLSRLYKIRAATVDGLPAAGGQVRLQTHFTLPR